MRGFGFKDNGFFICTETTPRCFVIQEVSDVNRALNDINKNSARNGDNNRQPPAESSPHIPFLPWWFTSECRQQLLSVPGPQGRSTPSGYEPSSTPEPPSRLSPEQLNQRLKNQLEYYFSRENLMNDRYLRSQMDADQYVPIKTVAGFPKVSKLTDDFNLIVQVLRDSPQVQVDESGLKVRPCNKRCTIILREIPEDAKEEEVKAMFDDCVNYVSLSYGLNNSWYVTFATEEDTQKAFMHLQSLGRTFRGKPIYARIKTGGAPIVTDSYQFGAEDKITTNAGTAYKTNVGMSPGGETVITGQITIHDLPFAINDIPKTSNDKENSSFSLGQILASSGFVPRASFRPSVTSTAAMAAAQGTDNSGAAMPAFSTPTVPASMPISVGSLQNKFLSNRGYSTEKPSIPDSKHKFANEVYSERSSFSYKSRPSNPRRSPYPSNPTNHNQKPPKAQKTVEFKEVEKPRSIPTTPVTPVNNSPPTPTNNNNNNTPFPPVKSAMKPISKWKAREEKEEEAEVHQDANHDTTKFGETDFPCLIEEERPVKTVQIKETKKPQFNAVVARKHQPPPPKVEDKRRTYAQTVKKC
ncbi:unnamed protein product [Bursaphelenchus xylophilus]|uniref:(pine wood nematode) hypothetical protein n=1 Tax=Bursaphelenchus xylophilus TaxID=6326 RepID=A0A1I7SC09_BURXY|nr:unnamed protein product [Bursaphelenchus xylophilus]CAG9086379.1 unnamed protein product [Bursaphelenchus xylophilus]